MQVPFQARGRKIVLLDRGGNPGGNRGQGTQREIEVSGGSLYRYSLTLEEDRKFVQHRNKFGQRYKQSYGR